MRYLAIYRPAATNSGPPTQEHMQAMGALVEEMMAAGALIGTEPLAPMAAGARVSREGEAYSVADETERVGGFALMQADSREAAIELAKRFLSVAGEGVCELRQIIDMGPPKG
ncbi:MAG TPA: YciI family protein [Caulobacteraceae bacterium]